MTLHHCAILAPGNRAAVEDRLWQQQRPIVALFSLIQAVFIGMMISSSLWGNISDKYGRKTVSLLNLLILNSLSSQTTLTIHLLPDI